MPPVSMQPSVDAGFDAFGVPASYTPPTGPDITCTVIADNRDRDLSSDYGRQVMQGRVIEVRVSELPAPVNGGAFALLDDDGNTIETVSIQGDPICDDPDRLVWRCTVR